MPSAQRILALLATGLALLALPSLVAGQLDQVESRPVDGQQFSEGQQFRFVCRAIGDQSFAVRLHCPLAYFSTGGVSGTACFENCGRPLCDQPLLNNCSATMPELLRANCTRSVRALSSTVQEIILEYTFSSASARQEGSYACQYKTMRSSVYIIVSATTTTSTTTTTTSTTTPAPSTTSSTTTTPSTTTTSTSSSTSISTSSSISTGSSTSSAKTSGASATPATVSKATISVTAPRATTTGATDPESTTATLSRTSEGSKTVVTTRRPEAETTEILLKAGGWFSGFIVGSLHGADVILICLLFCILIGWIISFLCIRCQVLATRSRTRQPVSACCSTLLCLGPAPQQQRKPPAKQPGKQPSHANGGLRKFAEQERKRSLPLTAMSLRTAVSADGLSAGPVYSEAVDGSYYSPDGYVEDNGERPPNLPLAGGEEDYYRLQQEFDDPLARSGFGTNPRSTFVPRDMTGRHSFQNARPAARQRPAIPKELLLKRTSEAADEGDEAGHHQPPPLQPPVLTRDEFKRRMDEQRREIASLRQQLRDSQLQLSQRAGSTAELDLRQSVGGPDARKRQAPAATSGGVYEMLARATSEALPPSPPPPPPPPSQPTSPIRLEPAQDADLPPPPPPLLPPPIGEHVAAGADDGTFGRDRRVSLGEAYRTGQRL